MHAFVSSKYVTARLNASRPEGAKGGRNQDPRSHDHAFGPFAFRPLRDAQCQQNHSRVAYTSPFALSGELTVDIMTPSVLDLGFLVRPDGYSLDYLPVWTVDDRGWARSRSRQVRAVRKTLHVSLQLSHRGNSVGACAGSSAARRWSVARCRLSWPWLGCAFTCLEPGQVFRLQSRRGDRSTLDVHTGSPLLRAGRQPGPLDDAVLAGGASRRSGGG